MATKLKFKVVERTERPRWNGPGSIGGVKLAPVTGGSDENKSFYEATPSGSIQFDTINEAALAEFPVGAEVYVTVEIAAQ